MNHTIPIKATVVAVRAATGFIAWIKLEEKNKMAIKAIMETKKATIAITKVLWLKSATFTFEVFNELF